MTRRALLGRGLALGGLLLAPALRAADRSADLGEVRRLTGAQPLPGQPGRPLPWPAGTRWTLHADRLEGPVPLAIARGLRQRLLRQPAEGLFEGALAVSGDAQAAARQAAALGLPGPSTATLRLEGPNASIDLHRAGPGRWKLALDGQVLTLEREGEPGDAQAVARELLLAHLAAGDVPFDAARLEALKPWLAPALVQRLQRWLDTPSPPDEVPLIDGDPFTDTQEAPRSITLGRLVPRGDEARQALQLAFEGGGAARTLHYRLQRVQGRWQLADVEYGHGPSLRRLLGKR